MVCHDSVSRGTLLNSTFRYIWLEAKLRQNLLVVKSSKKARFSQLNRNYSAEGGWGQIVIGNVVTIQQCLVIAEIKGVCRVRYCGPPQK